MLRWNPRLRSGLLLLGTGIGALTPGSPAGAPPESWIDIDYSSLVDRRQPTHSGECVGPLLERARGAPDRALSGLLEPLLEPYAFVLPDVVDATLPIHEPPFVEVGSLWDPGDAQPAWAELLRARRYLVESDGEGHVRAFLPFEGSGDPAPDAAASEAFRAAWPVLRRVCGAELRRLSARSERSARLEVDVYPYRHDLARSSFRLAARPGHVTVDDALPDGSRPPLDLAGIRRFLGAGLLLEGARVEADGTLRLLGSQEAAAPRLLGRPVELSDVAVAYRAVFHGGLAEPYMSLDRGYSPETSLVNYGGRLRDTSLGLVSLRCDVRFKTFSLGLDIERGEDVRERLRSAMPEFRSHLERMAGDPGSQGVASQQTRLWFYPDDVDLVLSPQGDVLAMRRVRMSAASERVSVTGQRAEGQADPPWTRATVAAINRDYDALARAFPELADLDQVVRLLSLFTWLRQVRDEGRLVPELDALLEVELPELHTPRTYPQLLAFNALPPAGSSAAVETLDRVPIADALGRLEPLSGRPLPSARRFRRAVALLDPAQPEQAALSAELSRSDPRSLEEGLLDLAAYRAERLSMHGRVLATVDAVSRRRLAERMKSGEQLRIFSAGIGGLDLGMGKAVERAQARSMGLSGRTAAGDTEPEAAPRVASAEWRRDPTDLPQTVLPAPGRCLSESGREPSLWSRTVCGADGPEVRARTLWLGEDRRAVSIERMEAGRLVRYRVERQGPLAILRPEPKSPVALSQTAIAELPPGLVALELVAPEDGPVDQEPAELGIHLTLGSGPGSPKQRALSASVPRSVLRRLVLGSPADPAAGQGLPGLVPPAEPLAQASAVMVLPPADRWLPPWVREPSAAAGEEDPLRVARALSVAWAAAAAAPAAVVGVDPAVSPRRFMGAPSVKGAALVLPADGFPPGSGEVRDSLASAWSAGPVVPSPAEPSAPLVVLVSAEPPAAFARRLRLLARDATLKGRLLLAWSLAGPVRADLPGSLLGEGNLAGLGLAEGTLSERRGAATHLAALSRAIVEARTSGTRVERLPGPFLWYF